MRNNGGARRWFAALSVVPVAVCAVLAFAFAYDAPYWDEWVYVEPIAKAFDGTLAISDFVVHVNEHLYITPNFLTIPLARLTHWNIYAEIAVILFFFIAIFGLFVAELRKVNREGSLWAMPVIACALFSFTQHAVWNWGLHISLAMAVFLLVVALRLLSGETGSLAQLACAITVGWAATFAIGGGLAVWPVGAAVLMTAQVDVGAKRWPALAAWLGAGALASGVYMWLSTATTGAGGIAAGNVISFAIYVLAFLGGPVSAFNGVAAAVMGGALVVAYGVMLRRGRSTFALGLGVAALTAGVLTALKHSQEGVDNAISSRFLPWGSLAWCGLVVAAYAKWPTVREMPRAVCAAVAVILIGVLASSGYGAYKAEERHDAFLLGRRALIENPASPDLIFLHPEPETLAERRELLIKYQLTVFQDHARED